MLKAQQHSHQRSHQHVLVAAPVAVLALKLRKLNHDNLAKYFSGW